MWPVRSDTSGRRVLGARLVFWGSGASGMGANAVDKKPTFFGVFKIKKAPLLAVVKDLNTSNCTRRQHFAGSRNTSRCLTVLTCSAASKLRS